LDIYTRDMVELSKVDKKLDSFKPIIEAANKKVQEAQKALDEALSRKEEIEKLIEENKLKIASYEDKIVETKKELEEIIKKSAKARTEREITAVSSEELIARDKLKFANEEINRLNHINEVKSKELEELNKEVEELQKRYNEVKEEALKEFARIDEEKEEFIKQREEIARRMSQKILAFYERIRKWAGNTAVVKVENQACYGCYMKISDKVYSDLIRGEDIVTCPHCGRVLYIEEKKEEVEA